MKNIKEGDIVYLTNHSYKTIISLPTIYTGGTFEVVRATKQHVFGRGIIAVIEDVSLFPPMQEIILANNLIKKELGL